MLEFSGESSDFALHQNKKLVLAKRWDAVGKSTSGGQRWLDLYARSLVNVGQEKCWWSSLLLVSAVQVERLTLVTQNVSLAFSGGKTSTGEAVVSSLFCSWCRRLWGGLLPGYR